MEFVISTYLDQPQYIKDRLGELTLHGKDGYSGMSICIKNIEAQLWPNVPVILIKDRDEIVAWALKNASPKWWQNIGKGLKMPEVQLFVAHDKRRMGYGRDLFTKATEVWGKFCVCPWDENSIAFFNKTLAEMR